MAQIGQVKQYSDATGTFPFIVLNVDNEPRLTGRVVGYSTGDFDAADIRNVNDAAFNEPTWQDIPGDISL